MNLFRCTPDKSLDHKYLRIAVVYRLLSRQKINVARARVLLAERHSSGEMKSLNALVDLWLSGPLRHALSS